jgi:hypothetical protein
MGADEKLKAVRDAVKIEPLAMQEEFVRIPADLSYWNAQYADLLRRFLVAKAESEHLWARIWMETRETLLIDGKATEKLIESKATCNPEWQKAHLALVELEAEKARVRGVVEAIEAKKEMLISLGAHLRAEMEGDPMVRRDVRNQR